MSSRDPDDKLVEQLRQTLDQCARQNDDAFDARLETLAQHARQTRQHRLAIKPKTLGLMLLGFSLAAGVAVIAIIPGVLMTPASTQISPQAPLPEPPAIDPQFLEDMDMLTVLGEDSHES